MMFIAGAIIHCISINPFKISGLGHSYHFGGPFLILRVPADFFHFHSML